MWGVCSKHCTQDTAQSSKMLEAKLDLIPTDKCKKLGESSGEGMRMITRCLSSNGLFFSGVKTNIEICASVKNSDTLPYIVFQKSGNGLKEIEQNTERIEYFGGSDACQGDSGGPL